MPEISRITLPSGTTYDTYNIKDTWESDEVIRMMIEHYRKHSDKIRRYYDNEFEQMNSDTSCLDEFFNELVVRENDIG